MFTPARFFCVGMMIVFAEVFVGLALYALESPKFPCQKAIEAIASIPNPAIQILQGTFSRRDHYRCTRRILDANKHRRIVVSVHLTNGVCVRNRRCASNELWYPLSKKRLNLLILRGNSIVLNRYRRRVELLGERVAFNDTKLYVSPILEDDLSQKAFDILCYETKAILPSAKVFRSKNGATKPIGGTCTRISELHGTNISPSRRTFQNLDGVSIDFTGRDDFRPKITMRQAARYIRTGRDKSRGVFLWRASWQGIESGPFVPPLERAFEFSDFDILKIKQLIRRTYGNKLVRTTT